MHARLYFLRDIFAISSEKLVLHLNASFEFACQFVLDQLCPTETLRAK
jgi:hypothetical protein